MSPSFQSCIDACEQCALACDQSSVAGLSNTNVAAMADGIRLAIDCATMCRAAAGAMARGSEFALEICELTAEICAACAVECERFERIAASRACAAACRRCEDECRRLAGHGMPVGRLRHPQGIALGTV